MNNYICMYVHHYMCVWRIASWFISQDSISIFYEIMYIYKLYIYICIYICIYISVYKNRQTTPWLATWRFLEREIEILDWKTSLGWIGGTDKNLGAFPSAVYKKLKIECLDGGTNLICNNRSRALIFLSRHWMTATYKSNGFLSIFVSYTYMCSIPQYLRILYMVHGVSIKTKPNGLCHIYLMGSYAWSYHTKTFQILRELNQQYDSNVFNILLSR